MLKKVKFFNCSGKALLLMSSLALFNLACGSHQSAPESKPQSSFGGQTYSTDTALAAFRASLTTLIQPQMLNVLMGIYRNQEQAVPPLVPAPDEHAIINTVEELTARSIALGLSSSGDQQSHVFNRYSLTIPSQVDLESRWSVRSRVAVDAWVSSVMEGRVLADQVRALLSQLMADKKIPENYLEVIYGGSAPTTEVTYLFPQSEKDRIVNELLAHSSLSFSAVSSSVTGEEARQTLRVRAAQALMLDPTQSAELSHLDDDALHVRLRERMREVAVFMGLSPERVAEQDVRYAAQNFDDLITRVTRAQRYCTRELEIRRIANTQGISIADARLQIRTASAAAQNIND